MNDKELARFRELLAEAMAAVETGIISSHAIPPPVMYKHGEPVLRVQLLGEHDPVTIPAVPSCTCRARHSPWQTAEHGSSCPQAVPGGVKCWCGWCKGRTGVHGAEAQALYQKQVAAARGEPVPEKQEENWMTAFWAAYTEPLGLPGEKLDQLAPYGASGCRRCHLGPVPPGQSSGFCVYCYDLAGLEAEVIEPLKAPAHAKLAGPRPARRSRLKVLDTVFVIFGMAIMLGAILAWIYAGTG